MFVLKDYQQRALDALRDYLALSRDMGAKRAFVCQTDRPYHAVEQLPGLPYVCIRIPTGGGKTVVACHAVGIAAQELQRQEKSLVLWLVPTNTIKDQTLRALRDRDHPYRRAVQDGAGGSITVLELAEALSLQRATLDSDTVVIVSTLAALRVEDTDGRKVYDQNGSLMSHFSEIPGGLQEGLEKYPDSDTVIPSLANVLRLRHPVVVVDEAHNARTPLSFDTLARFAPSCVLEFTATPAQDPPTPSNVLYHVSASELKAESMIKLPIRLQTNTDWKDALSAAIAKRAELEALAREEGVETGEYLRPIVLLQAQPRSQERDSLTVERVKQALADSGIAPEQVAIETGQIGEVTQWEREHKSTVFDERCPIRFIITVDKLREGWDCSFAYVLCSVRAMHGERAVEQILGRVLRMPRGTRKLNDELNHAYAFVTSHHFSNAAAGLADALVANGFTRFEARLELQPEHPTLDIEDGLFSQLQAKLPPAERGERLVVPQLALWVDGELEQLEDHFLQASWQLAQCDATLTEEEYPSRAPNADAFDVDVNDQGMASVHRAEARYVSELQRSLAFLMPRDIERPEQLAVWLDCHIPHKDVPQPQSIIFLLHLVEGLVKGRGIPVDQLARDRLRLRDATARKIEEHRRAVVRTAFQQILFGDRSAEVEVSAQRVFTYDRDLYPANSFYDGSYQFAKHYYRAVGAMNGEEEECAKVIDSLPNVRYWVRNLERRSKDAFWLQTSTDRFYPDFVVLLDDERIMAVEYKGSQGADTGDTSEKRALGGLWAAKSNGKCLFDIVTVEDYEARLRAMAQ